ncbi:MAG: hypothetical protein IJ215_02395 [Clostridia bacterium]|nr:hypothetical protein [Clostridia bacterium]
MKIYFIDKTGRNLRIKKLIEDFGIENVEHKDSYSFRCTKNDFIILSEYNEKEDNTMLKKFSNLIIVTNSKDRNVLWMLATEYKTLDIIYDKCGDEYIANRIVKLIA